MNLTTGKRILELSLSLDIGMGKIDNIINQMSDEDEKIVWAARLGNVMRVVNEQMIIPVLQLYPELDQE